MSMFFSRATKIFNLLSIGQRGVGKTVFLAGSYTELQNQSTRKLWFDSQDNKVQEDVERILNYVVQTRQYPPPTMKIADFSFSLKRQSLWGIETLCNFRWFDIPGEICTIHNLDFRRIVSDSNGCCVFIDAYALVNNDTYIQTLKELVEQVYAIATLVHLNGLKYPFALILTKCDLLEPGSFNPEQLKHSLQPLITRLNAARANYQTFYSLIPIVHTASVSTLKAKDAAAALLWVVCELTKAQNPGVIKNLINLFTKAQTDHQLQVDGLARSLSSTSKGSKSKKLLGLDWNNRERLFMALATIGLVGVFGLLLLEYNRVLERKSTNFSDTLSNIATLRQSGQYDQALVLMEKLIQQEPKRLNLRLQLAELYEKTGQITKAETVYDQVLTMQKNNFKALVGKAVLRYAQGDTKTGSALFVEAERVAPAGLKTQVHEMNQKILRLHLQPMPSTTKSKNNLPQHSKN